jgi:predicted ester cyclase
VGANWELLARGVELFRARDADAYTRLYAEDAVLTMPEAVYEGRAMIRERLVHELEAFPDAARTMGGYLEQGEWFAGEFVFTGTHTGPFALPDGSTLHPTGRRVWLREMQLARVADGRIVSHDVYFDHLAVLIQLGAVAQPVTA